ncbi:MAG: hypothetical protein ABF790_09555 [Liquorilactobacillus nagelii]
MFISIIKQAGATLQRLQLPNSNPLLIAAVAVAIKKTFFNINSPSPTSNCW